MNSLSEICRAMCCGWLGISLICLAAFWAIAAKAGEIDDMMGYYQEDEK